MKLYCGIDLGLRPKTAMTFMSYMDGMFHLETEVFNGLTDEKIESLIWKYRPEVTAIDAPLSASMEKIRPAEVELRKMLRAYSKEFCAEGSIGSPFGLMMFPITYRGKYLRQRLQPITDVIETHPLVDFVFLSGNPKDVEALRRRKQDTAIQRRILSKYVANLPEGLNDDQYDAVMAAMVACAYAGNTVVISILLKLPKLYNTDAEFVIINRDRK